MTRIELPSPMCKLQNGNSCYFTCFRTVFFYFSCFRITGYYFSCFRIGTHPPPHYPPLIYKLYSITPLQPNHSAYLAPKPSRHFLLQNYLNLLKYSSNSTQYKKKTNPIRSDKKPTKSDPIIKKRNPIRVNYCPNPIRIRSDSDRIRTPLDWILQNKRKNMNKKIDYRLTHPYWKRWSLLAKRFCRLRENCFPFLISLRTGFSKIARVGRLLSH